MKLATRISMFFLAALAVVLIGFSPRRKRCRAAMMIGSRASNRSLLRKLAARELSASSGSQCASRLAPLRITSNRGTNENRSDAGR